MNFDLTEEQQAIRETFARFSDERVAPAAEALDEAHAYPLELVRELAKIGERSLEFKVEFLRGSQRLAEGRYTTVCCEMCGGAFKTIAVPEEIRRVLESQVTTSGK